MGSGKTNYFRRKAHGKWREKLAANLPKGKFYRESLVPLIGACVSVECNKFKIHSKCIDGIPCKFVLLVKPRITKVPARVRNIELPEISHIWVALDDDWECTYECCCLILRGFIYEYEHRGFKNIGLKVVGTRFKKFN